MLIIDYSMIFNRVILEILKVDTIPNNAALFGILNLKNKS